MAEETQDVSLFRKELVFIDMDIKDREDMFRQLGAELEKQGYIKDTWLDAVMTREKNYPTGLHCPSADIAIPHTDPENLNKAYIAVIKPSAPVDFEPMGGIGDTVHAKYIINLGVMRHGGQVEVLQALMQIFMDEDATADILSQSTPEGVIEAITSRFGKMED